MQVLNVPTRQPSQTYRTRSYLLYIYCTLSVRSYAPTTAPARRKPLTPHHLTVNMSYNLDDIDAHIANLRSTLRFFTEALENTDHNSPEWLATDLLSLRNSSGRLQDGMQRFREQLLAGGLTEKKVWVKSRFQPKSHTESRPTSQPTSQATPKATPQAKSHLQSRYNPQNKPQVPDLTPQAARIHLPSQTPTKPRNRLSLHGSERGQTPEGTPRPSPPPPRVQSRVQTPNDTSRAQTEECGTSPQDEYPIQRIDVTEEVQRRLREARLRRLADSPSTSHKRNFDAMEGVEGEQSTGAATPTGQGTRKRMRLGFYEPVVRHTKRKEGNMTLGWEEVGKPVGGKAKRVRR